MIFGGHKIGQSSGHQIIESRGHKIGQFVGHQITRSRRRHLVDMVANELTYLVVVGSLYLAAAMYIYLLAIT
jgi:hypothetical protein